MYKSMYNKYILIYLQEPLVCVYFAESHLAGERFASQFIKVYL